MGFPHLRFSTLTTDCKGRHCCTGDWTLDGIYQPTAEYSEYPVDILNAIHQEAETMQHLVTGLLQRLPTITEL